MDQKLEALTLKLYNEGVQKAEAEAAKLLEKAQQEADAVRKTAERQAVELLAKAQDEAMQVQQRTRSELRMMTTQVREGLRQELENLLAKKIINEPVKEVLSAPDQIAALFATLVQQMKLEGKDLVLGLPEQSTEEWRSHVEKGIHRILGQSPVLHPVPGLKAGFQIGRSGEHYRLSFSEEDFSVFLRHFLSDAYKDLLNGEH